MKSGAVREPRKHRRSERAGVHPTAQKRLLSLIQVMNLIVLVLALAALMLFGILGWQIYYGANPHKRRDFKERK